jgi:DNA-binding PadR family transcriptional regulator
MSTADAMQGPWFGGGRGRFGPRYPEGWMAMTGGGGGRRGSRHSGGPGGGFPFGGLGFGGPGFPPFRRGPRVRRGDVRAAILALVAEQPLHGYQIIQEISERSGGVWRPSAGSVYPAVQQLEDEGLVRVEQVDGRKVVHLTDEGRAYVEAHEVELTAPWDAVSDSVADGVLELRNLVGQVAGAAMQVTHAGSPAQHAEAVRILADTRRALYRLLADDEPGGTSAGPGPQAGGTATETGSGTSTSE